QGGRELGVAGVPRHPRHIVGAHDPAAVRVRLAVPAHAVQLVLAGDAEAEQVEQVAVPAPGRQALHFPVQLRIRCGDEALGGAEREAEHADAPLGHVGALVQRDDGRTDRRGGEGRRDAQPAPLGDLRDEDQRAAGGERAREALQRRVIPATVREPVEDDPGGVRPATASRAVESRRQGLAVPPVGNLRLLDRSRPGPQGLEQEAERARHALNLCPPERVGPELRPARAEPHTRDVHTSSHHPAQPPRRASRRRFLRNVVGAATAAALPDLVGAGAVAAQAPIPAGAPGEEGEAFWRRVRDRFLIPPDRIYLNVGTLGPQPRPVVDAMVAAIRRVAETYPPGVPWDRIRNRLGRPFDADPEGFVLPRNTTEGMNWVAQGLELGAGDEVVTTDHEHIGGLCCWQLLAARRGIRLRVVSLPVPPADPEETTRRILAALTPRTRVLSISHVLFTNG